MADTTIDSQTSLTVRRTINATRDRVFAAWTTPEALKQWSAPGDGTVPVAEVDLRVGGKYRIEMATPSGGSHRVRGEYLEVNPPQRLVYTWFWETNPALGEMLITVDFNDRGAETEVVLVHSKLPSADAAKAHQSGWTGCLDKLQQLFA